MASLTNGNNNDIDSVNNGLPVLTRQLTGVLDNSLDDALYNAGDDFCVQNGTPTPIHSHGSPVVTTSSLKATDAKESLNFRWGGIKDPGVAGKENQDDYLVWESDDKRVILLCVLDGHGRELGKIASKAAKDAFFEYFSSPSTAVKLRQDAETTMENGFSLAHAAVRESFLRYYKQRGLVTKVEEGGFIVKRHPSSSIWHCVHGGTTASVAIILDRRILISANVGDSTTLLCGLGGNAHETEACLYKSSDPELVKRTTSNAPCDCSVLTSDHGPENPNEFYRMRQVRPCPVRGKKFSEMLFVYDGSARAKADCNQIFRVNNDESVLVTNNGSYYKSVRNEWASLVATPTHARFQDALAFTRSIGDLHLQVYGVSHRPDVAVYDLYKLFKIDEGGNNVNNATLTLCSDGIWDNWKFTDASKYVQDSRFWDVKDKKIFPPDRKNLDGVIQGNSPHAIEVAKQFMATNKIYAHKNFGKHADNMCLVVCQIWKEATS